MHSKRAMLIDIGDAQKPPTEDVFLEWEGWSRVLGMMKLSTNRYHWRCEGRHRGRVVDMLLGTIKAMMRCKYGLH